MADLTGKVVVVTAFDFNKGLASFTIDGGPVLNIAIPSGSDTTPKGIQAQVAAAASAALDSVEKQAKIPDYTPIINKAIPQEILDAATAAAPQEP